MEGSHKPHDHPNQHTNKELRLIRKAYKKKYERYGWEGVYKSGIDPAKKDFEKYPTIEKFCGDEGYRKSFEGNVLSELGLMVDISEKIVPGWAIIPKRWVVERTFAWANNSRRLSKDFEISIVSEEALLMISHLHTLLRRLGKL